MQIVFRSNGVRCCCANRPTGKRIYELSPGLKCRLHLGAKFSEFSKIMQKKLKAKWTLRVLPTHGIRTEVRFFQDSLVSWRCKNTNAHSTHIERLKLILSHIGQSVEEKRKRTHTNRQTHRLKLIPIKFCKE